MTLKHYAMARETRMILGVLLLLFSVIALLAYLSFLFTGTADQSVLSQAYADQVANRHEIRNILGLPGARLARFLIDGSFGFVSILMVLMCGTYALRIMHVLKDIKAIKIFCTTAFWVLWGSIVLGFIQQLANIGAFRWGGRFGDAAALKMESYVHITGMVLILAAVLVIFLIVTDPKFIDRCKAFGFWFVGLFKKKPKVTENG